MELLEGLSRFCQQITDGSPILVPFATETNSEPEFCFRNVALCCQRAGGRPQYGWLFQHAPYRGGPGFLAAIHHCVWVSPEGQLRDITPHEGDEHVVILDGQLVFLPDVSATPLMPAGAKFGIPRPGRFFALSNNQELKKLLRQLQRAEREATKGRGIRP